MTKPLTQLQQRQSALSRWDNEGGACADEAQAPDPDAKDHDSMLLRTRVIALESLIIAILASGSDRQLDAARAMATYILPQAGFEQHPLTVQAAHHVTQMVHRALHFRTVQSAS